VGAPSASIPAGAGLSAPDAGDARTYRQYGLSGRRPIHVILALEIAWCVIGGMIVVLLLQPGPDVSARLIVGLVLWIGPLVALTGAVLVGPRGPFRDWWRPRVVVRVDDRGLAWWTEGTVRRPEDVLDWTAVATVQPTFRVRNPPPGASCALVAPDGRILASLPCRLVRIDRPATRRWRRVAWLPDVAVAIRPDRYRRRRLFGRRAVLRDPEADATA
jgi:hypothetical protein